MVSEEEEGVWIRHGRWWWVVVITKDVATAWMEQGIYWVKVLGGQKDRKSTTATTKNKKPESRRGNKAE